MEVFKKFKLDIRVSCNIGSQAVGVNPEKIDGLTSAFHCCLSSLDLLNLYITAGRDKNNSIFAKACKEFPNALTESLQFRLNKVQKEFCRTINKWLEILDSQKVDFFQIDNEGRNCFMLIINAWENFWYNNMKDENN